MSDSMDSSRRRGDPPPAVAGIGVATGYGYGVQALRDGPASGRALFGPLQRPGRGFGPGEPPVLGIELPGDPPDALGRRVARTTGLTGHVAAAVVSEALEDAALSDMPAERIGLVVGGSNLQSREHLLTLESYAGERLAFLPPRQGHRFFDTDLCGLLASVFPIRGFAQTVGGASASGALAVHQAAAAVRAGRVDACIALGALQDLSHLELRALRALGAMGPLDPAAGGEAGCRPFDRARDGFRFGEASAALVLARPDLARRTYGSVLGTAHIVDGTHGPDPNPDGEARAIRMALADAGVAAEAVDLVSAHGTGTPAGDDAEVAALKAAGVANASVTAPKSNLGHGISAAGALEIALALLQMEQGAVFPIRGLTDPIDGTLNFVRDEPAAGAFRHALTLSFGFGGIDTATVLGRPA